MIREAIKDFRPQSIVKCVPITNFNPRYFFQDENPLGVKLLIDDTFREGFLQDRYITKHFPKTELRSLTTVNKYMSDWEILSKLEERTFFDLSLIAQLLVLQPEKDDLGFLKQEPGKNFFYVPTASGGLMKRVSVVGRTFAKSWRIKSEEIESIEECSPRDQIFVCWAKFEASLL